MKGGIETKRVGRGNGDTEGRFESGDTRSGMGIGRESKKGWVGGRAQTQGGERNKRE